MDIEFSINGVIYKINPQTVPIETNLITFIRDHAQLKGTKFMCLEGGCGACVVNLTEVNPVTNEIITKSVNSCLLPVYACHGRDILTVEGIGCKKSGYHPVQKRLAAFNGSQCGFCSTGMVMSMYSMLETNKGSVTMQEVENALDGNICRCTGYRPILDAFKSFATDVGENVKRLCTDIEELSVDNCLGKACNTVCSNASKVNMDPKQILHIPCKSNKVWYKVSTINQIFEIFKAIGSRPYMLLAGNSAHGVYRRNEHLEVFIDVNSVDELHRRSIGPELVVGGNVTIHDCMTFLENVSRESINFQYVKNFTEHLRLVANQPVRNIGTLAGNLMIKYQHPEFPSDVFLLLETVRAKLEIASENGYETVSPQHFLKMDMNKKILIKIVLPTFQPQNTYFKTYKTMPVAQNSQSYVNAGFLLEFSRSTTILESATICFGGINSIFTHASKTESFLIGKSPFSNEVLHEALKILQSELHPDNALQDASPVYRKNLAASLLYKFLLNIVPKEEVTLNLKYQSGGYPLDRALSSGKLGYDTYPTKWPLTQNIAKIEGLLQTSGEAEYINDMPKRPNELYAAFVLATQIRSRITMIDASEALKTEGVVAFYSAKNIPGINNFMPIDLGTSNVEEIFCSGEVAYYGQPVGVIVAESFEIANQATKLVKICYERTSLEYVYTNAKDIVKDGISDRLTNQGFDRYGSQFSSAPEGPIKVQGHLDLRGQYHYTLETQTCFCVPNEDGMEVFSATQNPNIVHAALHQALNVPQNSLHLMVKRLGGAYGAKSSRSSMVACACAIASHLTRRPVRMVLPMETNMSAIGKRTGSYSEYEIDVNKSGKINKLNHKFTHDGGFVYNELLAYLTTDMFKSAYATDRWNLVGDIARTDVAANTWCRCPGSSEGIAMIENIMEHIAHVTGTDPFEVRLRNMVKDSKLRQMLSSFRKDVDFDERRKQVDKFNIQNRWQKRGIGIICMEYPMQYSGSMNALVSIFHTDGTVGITHSGIEMGQGINTKVIQVAAKTLGLSIDMISVKPMSSVSSPNCTATVHSRGSETVAFAVQRCCEMLMERLRPYREQNPQGSWQDVLNQAFLANVDLTALYGYAPFDLEGYVIYATACAEVEVDILTGNLQVSRVDILQDVGKSMSPGIDIGQVEGSFIMGLGYYLIEALIYDPSNGALVNNRSWNYKVPGAKDIPVDFRVKFLKNSSNKAGVLGSKATGEPSFCMSPVLTYALRYALRSARKDAGLPDDWISIGTGTTPEKIFLMAGNSLDDYKFN
ncbi:xanthine dehydrogenase/oxidase-like [Uranotaenia lowii]|uniref:xanthine dehydrogenase/oxidase-like n=1 Tax=Uranotaenia lowii TaxID=190385 RepID=UPI00247939C1|nr:xanthine dehydrogenase/oxidase-like [Uranotaenia lowii]